MSTINISLPDSLMAFVEEQARARGYETSSEYVRELISNDQDRLLMRESLLQGTRTEPSVTVDETYFEVLRNRVRHDSDPLHAPGLLR